MGHGEPHRSIADGSVGAGRVRQLGYMLCCAHFFHWTNPTRSWLLALRTHDTTVCVREHTHARARAHTHPHPHVCVCARACVCVQIPFDTRRSGAHGSTVWVRDRDSRATLPGIPMLQHGCTVLNGIVLCCARLYCAMLQSTSPFPVRQHTAPNSTYASASVPCKSQRTVWTALGLEHRPRRSGLTPTYSQPSMRLLHRSPVGTVTCA